MTFLHVLIGLFAFALLCFENSLYIPDISFFFVVNCIVCKYFLPHCSLFLDSLNRAKGLNFDDKQIICYMNPASGVRSKNSFISSFLTYMPFTFLLHWPELLVPTGFKSGHLCLVPYFRWKHLASSFSPLSIMPATTSLYLFFIWVRMFPSGSTFLRVFNMNGCHCVF